MKAHLFSILLVLSVSSAFAQDAASYQAAAMKLYPQLKVAGSPMNVAYVAAVQAARRNNDPVLRRQSWPLVIAEKVAAQLMKPSPSPAASPH
jgi:hypothetical protein